ncbi:MAG TPA: hypothetical protein VGK10_01560, partial [Prolixibacteraceae bacterium]
MKFRLFLLSILTCLIAVNQLFSQSNKILRQQHKYLTSYENSTLSGNDLPVLMPYNKWVDPAGMQIYFGDKDLENHALDCAVSPDGKWIAVEGRYSVVIISPESKKIISRFVLKSYFSKDGLMNSFSGISWRKSGDNYEL